MARGRGRAPIAAAMSTASGRASRVLTPARLSHSLCEVPPPIAVRRSRRGLVGFAFTSGCGTANPRSLSVPATVLVPLLPDPATMTSLRSTPEWVDGSDIEAPLEVVLATRRADTAHPTRGPSCTSWRPSGGAGHVDDFSLQVFTERVLGTTPFIARPARPRRGIHGSRQPLVGTRPRGRVEADDPAAPRRLPAAGQPAVDRARAARPGREGRPGDRRRRHAGHPAGLGLALPPPAGPVRRHRRCRSTAGSSGGRTRSARRRSGTAAPSRSRCGRCPKGCCRRTSSTVWSRARSCGWPCPRATSCCRTRRPSGCCSWSAAAASRR